MELFILDVCDDLDGILRFVKLGIIPLIQIGIPILLIVMGSIDLGKAVIGSDEKKIKEAQGMLVKRAIAAVAVFFISTIVLLLFNLFTSSNSGIEGTNSWHDCWGDIQA